MPLPNTLRVNAFLGDAPAGASALGPALGARLVAPIEKARADLAPEALANESDWGHPKVGWGLVLPENPALSAAEQAGDADAPEPIRALRAAREGVVLRCGARAGGIATIRRYTEDGRARDVDLVGSAHGRGVAEVPRYLLVYAPVDVIPWEVQFRLHAVAFVGRLDLEGPALERYVEAAIAGFPDASARLDRAVVWAVDHGGGDITTLMRGSIAAKVHAKLQADNDIGAGAIYVNGQLEAATQARLREELAQNQPALIVTTSHGKTGPLADHDRLRVDLGLLVDSDYTTLDVPALLDGWSPGGGIWYAHACCSVGSTAESGYQGMLEDGSPIASLLAGLAAAGECVSPLPRALLGAASPLRAFVGHVEPTFDWTLQHPKTKQVLTRSIRTALHQRLYLRQPIGRAFDEIHAQASQLWNLQRKALRAHQRGDDVADELLALQLTARDRESLVIYGDPAVALPA
ncbi:MAG: hypothetical protein GY937_18820 [bacterium]|nr:hypothetical protein [bacterium]